MHPLRPLGYLDTAKIREKRLTVNEASQARERRNREH